jgi:hypothetical protein
MKAVVSVLVVMTAIEKVFHTPGVEHYGKEFDPGQMHSLGPYLVATEEQAWYVLTLMSSCWMNEAEPDGVRQLAFIMAKLPRRGNDAWDDVDRHSTEQTICYKVVNEGGATADSKYDFNQLTLKGTLDAIAERLSKAPGERMISKENARAMLYSMKGRTVTVARRGDASEAGGAGYGEITLPILEADGDSGNKWSLSTAWALDAATMYGEAKMKEVIAKTFHPYTRERKVITGFTHKDYTIRHQPPRAPERRVYPHVYQILDARPRAGCWFKVANKPNKNPAYFIADESLDKWAYDQHCEDNAYPCNLNKDADTINVRFNQHWDGHINYDYPKDALSCAIAKDQALSATANYANGGALPGDKRLSGVKRRKLGD